MPRLRDMAHSDRRWDGYVPYYDDNRTAEAVRGFFKRGMAGCRWTSPTFEAMGAAMFYLCEQWLDADGLG